MAHRDPVVPLCRSGSGGARLADARHLIPGLALPVAPGRVGRVPPSAQSDAALAFGSAGRPGAMMRSAGCGVTNAIERSTGASSRSAHCAPGSRTRIRFSSLIQWCCGRSGCMSALVVSIVSLSCSTPAFVLVGGPSRRRRRACRRPIGTAPGCEPQRASPGSRKARAGTTAILRLAPGVAEGEDATLGPRRAWWVASFSAPASLSVPGPEDQARSAGNWFNVRTASWPASAASGRRP